MYYGRTKNIRKRFRAHERDYQKFSKGEILLFPVKENLLYEKAKEKERFFIKSGNRYIEKIVGHPFFNNFKRINQR